MLTNDAQFSVDNAQLRNLLDDNGKLCDGSPSSLSRFLRFKLGSS